jgi:hypothetical protein
MSGIRDRSIAWKTCRMFIPCQDFSLDDNGTNTISLAQGTSTIEPCSGTLEQVMIPFTTADEVEVGFPIPWNMDRDKKVLARVFFIHASTDADTGMEFILGSLFFARQAQTVEVKGGAECVATKVHGTCSTNDDSLEVTEWFDTLWDTKIDVDDIFVGVNLECNDDGSAEGDEMEFVGIEFMWEIKATDVRRRHTDHQLAAQPV